jgi:hypothetical protein
VPVIGYVKVVLERGMEVSYFDGQKNVLGVVVEIDDLPHYNVVIDVNGIKKRVDPEEIKYTGKRVKI